VLLDIAHHKLYFEIVVILFGDLVQPVKNGPQIGQVGDQLDLLIQALQFIERIQVFAHDVYPTLAS
jgi:hypothetical protein